MTLYIYFIIIIIPIDAIEFFFHQTKEKKIRTELWCSNNVDSLAKKEFFSENILLEHNFCCIFFALLSLSSFVTPICIQYVCIVVVNWVMCECIYTGHNHISIAHAKLNTIDVFFFIQWATNNKKKTIKCQMRVYVIYYSVTLCTLLKWIESK